MIKKSNEDFSLKIMLLGDTNVGKTSVVLKFINANMTIDDNYIATIGMDQKVKYVDYKDYKIKLEIWDSAGQERFNSITTNYIKGADGILYVFDLTCYESLNNLKNWFKMAEKIIDTKSVKRIIMANKSDLSDRFQVSKTDIAKLSEKFNFKWIETSALLGENISEAFMLLIDEILSDDRFDQLLESKRRRMTANLSSIYTKQNKKGGGCCG